MSEYKGEQTYKIRRRDVGCFCFSDQYVHWLENEIERLRSDASYQCAAGWRDKYHAAEAENERLRQVIANIRDDTRHMQMPDYCSDDGPMGRKWLAEYEAETRCLIGEEPTP